MQIRGQFSDFFFETMLPALNAKIWQNYKAKKPKYNKLLNTDTTSKSIEQFAQVAGVGLPVLIAEGEDITTDNFAQGFYTNFKPAKYGLGIPASLELVEDDKFGIIARRAVALSNSIYQAREIQGASVYNNAFDTTGAYYGSDGCSLISATHPLIKAGGVQSNMLSVAADLDVGSLELALTDWDLIKTHEGFLQMLPHPLVVTASANRFNAAEILKSQTRSDTANRVSINAFQSATEDGAAIQSETWSFLTNPDAWYLVGPACEQETLWLDRKPPYTTEDFVKKNETGYVYMRYRATFGFFGWRAFYGTPGA
jgi:hypothetical protein